MQENIFITMSVQELQGLIREAVRAELAQQQEQRRQEAENPLLPLTEVCKCYGIAASTLRKVISSRELRSFKRGKRVWLDRNDVEEYIRGGHRRSLRELESEI